MPDIQFSTVIPVYNSNRSLPELVQRLNAVFRDSLPEHYEIILVDDASPRLETWEVLRSLAQKNPCVRVFRLSRNFGQAGALLCGMAQARGRWVVTMDDDLQHRPEDIPLLAGQREHDVVIARFPEKRCAYWKKVASDLKANLDVHLLGKPRHLAASPFRLLKRRVVQDILGIRTPRPFMISMILSVTSDVVNVDVTHEGRKFGRSNYGLRKSLALLSNLLFNNSSFMLRMMSLSGFVVCSISFLCGVVLIFQKISHNHIVSGWTSLMVVLLMSTGAIVCSLGIIGEYVARLIATAESRPTYLIRERIDYSAGGEQ